MTISTLWNNRATGADGTAGNCTHCGVPMMTEYAWRTRGRRPEGWSFHMGRGLCARDYSRWLRNGDLEYRPPSGTSRVTCADEVPTYRCEDCGRLMASLTYLERFPELRDGGIVRLGSRAYCVTHYRRRVKDGEIERVTRSREEVLEDWAFLRDDGVSLTEAAQRMGMKRKTLEQALYRARKRGDLRGSTTPFAHDMRRAA